MVMVLLPLFCREAPWPGGAPLLPDKRGAVGHGEPVDLFQWGNYRPAAGWRGRV